MFKDMLMDQRKSQVEHMVVKKMIKTVNHFFFRGNLNVIFLRITWCTVGSWISIKNVVYEPLIFIDIRFHCFKFGFVKFSFGSFNFICSHISKFVNGFWISVLMSVPSIFFTFLNKPINFLAV